MSACAARRRHPLPNSKVHPCPPPAPARPAQYRHHRPRRPRQDHAGRPAVPPVRHLPRQPAGRRAGDGFQRPGKRARDHHPRQVHLGRVGRPTARHAHQHRRHPRPRRFRRRGGAHPVDGRRRDPAGRQLRRRDAADQVRHRQGAGARASSRSSWSTRSTAPTSRTQEVLDEVFDLFVSLDANDEQLDFPVLYASGRNGYASDDTDAREGTLTPLFEKIVEHVPAARRRFRRAVQVPRHPARSRQLPRPHPDRQGPVGHDQGQLADPRARQRRQGRRDRPRLQADGVPRARARAGRRSARGRHHLDRRADRRDRRPTPSPILRSPSRSTPSRSTRRRCRCALPSTTARWPAARAPRSPAA